MLNLHEVEAAIRDLENGSATYNNCMKLASLYIVRDELRKKESMYNYSYHYPMNYEHKEQPVFYGNDDLMIKKDMPSDYRRM